MTTAIEITADQLFNSLSGLDIDDQGEMQNLSQCQRVGCGSHSEVCAICLDKIVLEETALVKGCEHAYCVTCILQWASYKEDKPTCPQCKHPFESLNIHRSLDGSIHDYMFEESVCLLLRAAWFHPSTVEDHEINRNRYEETIEDYYQINQNIYYDEYYHYEDEGDDDDVDLDEVYFSGSSSVRIGNRRWGDNGYVRAGRQEARPVGRPNIQGSGAGSSREPKKKEPVKDTTGRRAKRALKREAADKAAAAKHQHHLERLGRN